MLMWFQIPRFVWHWTRMYNVIILLMVLSSTHRTSRSFWKFHTVNPTSVWLFTGWGEHCFWMSWTSKNFSWALLRWSIYYLRPKFELYRNILWHYFLSNYIDFVQGCRQYVTKFPLLCVFKTGDWTWLKEFYQRLIDQKWQRKKKSKERWYQKAILSKFLYYRWVELVKLYGNTIFTVSF